MLTTYLQRYAVLGYERMIKDSTFATDNILLQISTGGIVLLLIAGGETLGQQQRRLVAGIASPWRNQAFGGGRTNSMQMMDKCLMSAISVEDMGNRLAHDTWILIPQRGFLIVSPSKLW
jgi:hypothetical protein